MVESHKTDRRGRLIGVVRHDGKNINVQIVDRGLSIRCSQVRTLSGEKDIL